MCKGIFVKHLHWLGWVDRKVEIALVVVLFGHIVFDFVDNGVVEFPHWDTGLSHGHFRRWDAHCTHSCLVNQPGQTADLVLLADILAF